MKSLQKNHYGFTLVELLIVVAIIGVLAAIAIPQMVQYQRRGYAVAVKADVNLVHKSIWIWFGDNSNSSSCPSVGPITGPQSQLSIDYPGASVSNGVTITVIGGNSGSYRVIGTHVGLKSGNSYEINGSGTVTDNLL